MADSWFLWANAKSTKFLFKSYSRNDRIKLLAIWAPECQFQYYGLIKEMTHFSFPGLVAKFANFSKT